MIMSLKLYSIIIGVWRCAKFGFNDKLLYLHKIRFRVVDILSTYMFKWLLFYTFLLGN